MKKVLKYILLCMISWQLMNCGYTKTEDDKFPEMASFPDHSNPKITIEPAGMLIDTLYESRDDKLLAHTRFMNEENNAYSATVIAEYDKNLRLLDSVRVGTDYFVGDQGTFYIKNYDSSVWRYDHVNAAPELIALHPFDGNKFKEELQAKMEKEGELALKNFPDSMVYDIVKKIDRITYQKALNRFKNTVLNDLQCVKLVGFEKILVYPDKELQLNSVPDVIYDTSKKDLENCYDLIYKYQQCDPGKKYIEDYKSGLTMTDKAVTHNGSSGGNHFSFGSFYTIGYEYYDLKIGNELTSFKNYGKYVGSHRIYSRKLPGTDYLLLDIRKDDHYDYPQSYIARVKK